MALQTAPPSHYRFYLLRGDNHIWGFREDDFADDAAAKAAAHHVIADYPSDAYPGVEIWCEQRRVITVLRAELDRLRLPVTACPMLPMARLISRNKRLLQQAAACRRTEALRTRHGELAKWRPRPFTPGREVPPTSDHPRSVE